MPGRPDNVVNFPLSDRTPQAGNPLTAEGVARPGEGEAVDIVSPEDYNRARAAVVFTHCWGILSEAMLDEEEGDKAAPTKIVFDNAPNAWIGRQGYVRLFPDYPSSPVGKDRGGMAFYDIEEVMIWIGRTFPDIVEIVSEGVSEEID